MSVERDDFPGYKGPASCALADWRRRINELYREVRTARDPAGGHARWLEVRGLLFRHHPASPLPKERRSDFHGIDAFPYDPSLRFEVGLTDSEGPARHYDLGPDGVMACRPVAVTDGLGSRLGRELTVYWLEGYGGGLFLPFIDATAGTETYGGGRYVLDTIKGADLGLSSSGRLIIDFNFAYNPSCAINEHYVCPLAPAENRLPAAVGAGERVPGAA